MLKELLVRLGLDDKKLQTGAKRVEGRFAVMGAKIKGVMAGVVRSVKGLTSAIFSLQGAIATALVGGVVKAADSFNQLQGKIKNVLNETENFNDVFKTLVKSANETGSSIDAVAQSFVRLKPAADRIGASNDQLVKFTETFSKMGALAGATTEEINGGMIQLAQGIASGKLQGDELKTIMEAMPLVVTAIAEAFSNEFGISVDEARGQIKQLAADGKITPDLIFQGILDKADETDAKFQKLPPSVQRSFQKMVNSSLLLLNKLNEITGITTKVSQLFEVLTAVVNGLSQALNGNSSDVDNNADSQDQLSESVDGTTDSLKDNVKQLNQTTKTWAQSMADISDFVANASNKVLNGAAIFFKTLDLMAAQTANAIVGVGGAFLSAFSLGAINIGVNDKMKARAEQLKADLDNTVKNFNRTIKTTIGKVEPVKPFEARGGGGGGGSEEDKDKNKKAKKEVDELKKLAENIRDGVRTVSEQRAIAINELNRAKAAYGAIITDEIFSRQMEKINKDYAANIEGVMGDFRNLMENELRPTMESINEIESEGVKTSSEFNERQAEKMRILEGLITPLQEYQEEMALINEMLADGAINQEEFNAALENAQEKYENATNTGTNYGNEVMGMMRGIGQTTEDALISVFQNGQFSVKQFFASILEDIARLIFRITVLLPLLNQMQKLLSGGSGGGVWGKLFGGLVGGLGGGGAAAASSGSQGFSSAISGFMSGQGLGLPGFADGGRPPIGRPSIVGEEGPEIIYPQTSSYVAPNGTSLGGGGSNVTQNINIQGDVTRSVRAEVLRMAPGLQKATIQAIKGQIQSGGDMARYVGRLR